MLFRALQITFIVNVDASFIFFYCGLIISQFLLIKHAFSQSCVQFPGIKNKS